MACLLTAGVGLVRAQPKAKIGTGATLGQYYVFVSPDNYYKLRGDQVTFYGNHFSPNEVVNVLVNGIKIDTVVTNAYGNFISKSYQVTFTDAKIPYTFVGTRSGLSFTSTITVSGGGAWITLSSYYAPAGSSIVVSGHNFAKNETVNVWFEGIYQGGIVADSSGDFNKIITITTRGAGDKSVRALGLRSGIMATQSFSQAW